MWVQLFMYIYKTEFTKYLPIFTKKYIFSATLPFFTLSNNFDYIMKI